eukprot:CAMPEP_0117456936 /NCGR_PEP_ID=MMETSP0784-20121206/112_1 /TAXON_ID=39447 /ORGANISM="" /LENGTH=70 /DNA_ID=CAMNT_0005250319 /DNA_START=237 /DNA_END=449 /DNA_ORIENTATION=+
MECADRFLAPAHRTEKVKFDASAVGNPSGKDFESTPEEHVAVKIEHVPNDPRVMSVQNLDCRLQHCKAIV